MKIGDIVLLRWNGSQGDFDMPAVVTGLPGRPVFKGMTPARGRVRVFVFENGLTVNAIEQLGDELLPGMIRPAP